MDKKENILVTGSNSIIFKELKKLFPKNVLLTELNKENIDMSDLDKVKKKLNFFLAFDKVIFLQGLLIGKKQNLKSTKEIYDQLSVNLLSIVEICEYIIEHKKNVKIIILGSESGLKGSFDKSYFLSKSALHHYVLEKKLKYKNQQLVCISPSTIGDSKMTLNRSDKKNLLLLRKEHPKRRFLKSSELANLIYKVLFEITDYISNTIIHVDGGKFSRMD
jgi:NAD(P)-dependent dehydrogenase (short-subunit alcohol dehydrogenase family)